MPDIRRQLIDLGAQRATFLNDAETALANNDQEAYKAAMNKITNINTEMQQRQALIDERDRQFEPVKGAERRDMIEDRVNELRNGRGVVFTTDEIRREIKNSLTIATGTLTQPVGSGTTIHDPVGIGCSSIIDQVRTIDLTGLSAWQEPYVKSVLAVTAAKPETNAGKARAESDAAFGVAELRPYEVTVTSYVDRNIERLTNAAYYDKVYSMAMTALRKKIADLIPNGDGDTSPIFYGIKTAKNKASETIFTAKTLTAIDVNTLDDLYFAYGDDESVGGDACLLLTKANLAAIGKIRGANEKRRLFNISHAVGSSNTGIIEDGGTIIPYTLSSIVGDTTLMYGDPANYLLGLFGNYSVRVDESYKAGERLLTILGDAMVGGNLVVDKGFVVATIGG